MVARAPACFLFSLCRAHSRFPLPWWPPSLPVTLLCSSRQTPSPFSAMDAGLTTNQICLVPAPTSLRARRPSPSPGGPLCLGSALPWPPSKLAQLPPPARIQPWRPSSRHPCFSCRRRSAPMPRAPVLFPCASPCPQLAGCKHLPKLAPAARPSSCPQTAPLLGVPWCRVPPQPQRALYSSRQPCSPTCELLRVASHACSMTGHAQPWRRPSSASFPARLSLLARAQLAELFLVGLAQSDLPVLRPPSVRACAPCFPVSRASSALISLFIHGARLTPGSRCPVRPSWISRAPSSCRRSPSSLRAGRLVCRSLLSQDSHAVDPA
jgi:hypothetical protein